MFLIPLQALKVRQADVTRETVQKSVCVLSRVVRIELKLHMLEVMNSRVKCCRYDDHNVL